MKSLVKLLLFLCPFFVGQLYAQDAPKKPSDIGVDQFDTFKNNSFNIMNEATRADSDIVRLDKEVKTYAGVMATANLEKLKKDYSATMELNKYRKTLVDKISQLDNEGKAVLSSAKSFSPKMKSVSAVNNTNKAIKALDFSRGHLTNSAALLKNNAALLSKELKARGEKVEDFVE